MSDPIEDIVRERHPELSDNEATALLIVLETIWDTCMLPAHYLEVIWRLAENRNGNFNYMNEAVGAVMALVNKGIVHCSLFGMTQECYLDMRSRTEAEGAANNNGRADMDYQRVLQMPIIAPERLDVGFQLRHDLLRRLGTGEESPA